ncbi:hypothetical protein CDAR_538891 [Caerostris darwini]|uniref:Secreted protein n=1 Tax=Caerostris darwini TaxID=1538125 RepID=A0AAV4T224_9ARAC|nr:hypothetical protein CDAR_538891 [Caerostris darwini]
MCSLHQMRILFFSRPSQVACCVHSSERGICRDAFFPSPLIFLAAVRSRIYFRTPPHRRRQKGVISLQRINNVIFRELGRSGLVHSALGYRNADEVWNSPRKVDLKLCYDKVGFTFILLLHHTTPHHTTPHHCA